MLVHFVFRRASSSQKSSIRFRHRHKGTKKMTRSFCFRAKTKMTMMTRRCLMRVTQRPSRRMASKTSTRMRWSDRMTRDPTSMRYNRVQTMRWRLKTSKCPIKAHRIQLSVRVHNCPNRRRRSVSRASISNRYRAYLADRVTAALSKKLDHRHLAPIYHRQPRSGDNRPAPQHRHASKRSI